MSTRHEAIGIKQAIRFEWMQKTANLLLSGLEPKSVRQELHEFLAARKGNGSEGERGETSRRQVVTLLMHIWGNPDPVLIPFRDASLAFLRNNASMDLPLHWAMISATYPFWYHVARQTGRLLALQNQVTKAQITSRLRELYGDRQTVSRYTRYVIRSFVAWGVLKDSESKGCYEKNAPFSVSDSQLAILMFESVLHATPEGKGTLGSLVNDPAFFPFQLPVLSGDLISQRSDRIDVDRYGLDDELLKINESEF